MAFASPHPQRRLWVTSTAETRSKRSEVGIAHKTWPPTQLAPDQSPRVSGNRAVPQRQCVCDDGEGCNHRAYTVIERDDGLRPVLHRSRSTHITVERNRRTRPAARGNLLQPVRPSADRFHRRARRCWHRKPARWKAAATCEFTIPAHAARRTFGARASAVTTRQYSSRLNGQTTVHIRTWIGVVGFRPGARLGSAHLGYHAGASAVVSCSPDTRGCRLR